MRQGISALGSSVVGAFALASEGRGSVREGLQEIPTIHA